MLMPAIRAIALPLPLLVARVGADDQHRSMAADDLALLAHRLDRRSYLHEPLLEDWRTRAQDRDPAAGATREHSEAPQPTVSCQGVSTRGPSAVIAIVNSKWAASDPSWE